jgi:hypothetical protein
LLSYQRYISFGSARYTAPAGRGKNAVVDRKKEILTKLEQIQEQAQLTLDELPLRLAKDRLRLIIGLARYLSTTVDVNWEDLDGKRATAAAVEAGATPPPAAPRA